MLWRTIRNSAVTSATMGEHIGERRPRCSVHPREFKDLFCENGACMIWTCQECLAERHRRHAFKTRSQVFKEHEAYAKELGKRCQTRKNSLRGKLEEVERRRRQMESKIQARKNEIIRAYEEKVELLNRSKESLTRELESLKQGYHHNFNEIQDHLRQNIDEIDRCYASVTNINLYDLEKDCLKEHKGRVANVEDMFRESFDINSAKIVEDTAKAVIFHKSRNDPTLGKI